MTQSTHDKIRQEAFETGKNSRFLNRQISTIAPTSNFPTLLVILKTDVAGTFEAISNSINTLKQDKVAVKIISGGVGNVSTSDTDLAGSLGAVVVAFNIQVDKNANDEFIEKFTVIYELLDRVKQLMVGKLPKVFDIDVKGEAQVLQLFDITNKKKIEKIAGCRVLNGKIHKSLEVSVTRDGENVWKGSIKALKFIKKDITEALKGSECGIALDYTDIMVGDKIQSFVLVEKEQFL